MLGDDEFAAWFRLLETPGVGRDTARRLLAACGSPDAVFAARPATLRQLVSGAVAEALQSEPETLAPRLAAARHWLQGGTDRGVLTLGDAAYPQRLLQIADPPLLLYVQGDAARLAAPSIAVVGSRHPTPQGADNARAFAQALCAQGYVVVSGLAEGIDGAAHEGALGAAAGGAGTVAVVGTGLDRVFPPRHRELAHRIAAQGAATAIRNAASIRNGFAGHETTIEFLGTPSKPQPRDFTPCITERSVFRFSAPEASGFQ